MLNLQREILVPSIPAGSGLHL